MPHDAEKGIDFLIFIFKNLSLIILVSLILYIPALWSKRKKYYAVKYFVTILLFSALFSAAAIFSPYKNHPNSLEIETGCFYTSEKNILFVDKAQNNRLSGVIKNKNSSTGEAAETAETYSGRYTISEDMVLILGDSDNKYIIERTGLYHKAFGFFMKISSFMAEKAGESKISSQAGNEQKFSGFRLTSSFRLSDLKELLIKSFAIIITITTISFFFSTGRWPLVNYPFSQALVICFIWLNYYIQKFPIPKFLQGIENLIPFESGIYYFAYIVISFCILLIKLLSLRVRK